MKFTASLPFDNIRIGGFMDIIEKCQIRVRDADGHDDREELDIEPLAYVDLDNLIEALKVNDAFAKDIDRVKKVLETDEFKHKGELHEAHDKGHPVDTGMLLSLALITCSTDHTNKDSSKVFYEITNPGGYTRFANKMVGAEDEEMLEALKGMCALVTRNMIEFYHTLDDEGKKQSERLYSSAELKKLQKAEDDVIESWVDYIFADNSRIEAHTWINKVNEPGALWFYNP